jgi:hypothetical protein
MVPILSLLVPILVSAVLVFLVSAIIHMVLPIHKNDWKKVGKEDEFLDAVRKAGLTPGDYMAPCAGGYKIVLMTVRNGGAGMGKSLLLWFLYIVLVGVFAAYLTGRAFGPGTDYLTIFRYTGTTAFMGYSLALLHDSIWYHRSWATTFRHLIDGMLYGLLTAGVFGSMWPDS